MAKYPPSPKLTQAFDEYLAAVTRKRQHIDKFLDTLPTEPNEARMILRNPEIINTIRLMLEVSSRSLAGVETLTRGWLEIASQLDSDRAESSEESRLALELRKLALSIGDDE